MLKFNYVSDLHLDFWVRFTKDQTKWEQRTRDFANKYIENSSKLGDVLIIAGDISHYNQQSVWFVDEISKYFKQVFIVFGNHDYYLVSKTQATKYNRRSHNRIDELIEELRCHSNVKCLYNEDYIYEGYCFYGSTMWYPIKTINQENFFYNKSNDSKLIENFNFYDAHDTQLYSYNQVVDDIDIMISHVPLTEINTHRKSNHVHCYLTPVTKLAPVTIQGHCHEQKIYHKDDKTILMNAVGYDDEGGKVELAYYEYKKETI